METIVKDGKKYKLVPVEDEAPIILEAATHKFEVYPEDAPETMTYIKANEWVNGLGEGWRIPTLDELYIICDNKDKINGLCLADKGGSDYPDWYWSSTEHRDNRDYQRTLRLSDGIDVGDHRDYNRLSCRPVRLVAPSAS